MNDDIQGRYGTYSKHWVWDSKVTFSPVPYADCSISVNNIFDKDYAPKFFVRSTMPSFNRTNFYRPNIGFSGALTFLDAILYCQLAPRGMKIIRCTGIIFRRDLFRF